MRRALKGSWTCAHSGTQGAGAYGDPCELINVCEPGLICVASAQAPPGLPCSVAAGCCIEICDLSDPLGDQQCSGAAEGQQCLPWYDDGAPSVLLDDVGACLLP